MKKLFLGYLVRFLFGAIALGVGIWYVSSSLSGASLTYTSMEGFLKSIGAGDGNIASTNGCFLCKYVNDLFFVLGDASESFWHAIVSHLWILMVIGFGIFLFIHSAKYIYKAMTDTVSVIGGKIGEGTSGGSSSSNRADTAKSSKSNNTSGNSSNSDFNKTSTTPDFASSGGTGTKTDRYRYAQLEWLGTSGQEFIITGIKPTDATGIKIKFNQSVSGDQAVVWSGLSNGTFGVHVANTLFLPFNEDWTAGDVGVNVATNSDYEVSINYMNDRKRYVNGVSKLDITNTLSSSITNIKLFDSVATGSARFTGRVYYLQITEGKSLVRDMVPAQLLIGGETKGDIGMYDLVSHEFHSNAGLGKFTAGPIVGYLEKI